MSASSPDPGARSSSAPRSPTSARPTSSSCPAASAATATRRSRLDPTLRPDWCSPARPARRCSPPAASCAGRTAATHWLAGPLLERYGVDGLVRAGRRRSAVHHVHRPGSAFDAALLRRRQRRRARLVAAIRAELADGAAPEEPAPCAARTRYRPPAPRARRVGHRRGRARGAPRRRGDAGHGSAGSTARRGIIAVMAAPGRQPPTSAGRATSSSATARRRSSGRSRPPTRRRSPPSTDRQPRENLYRRFFSPKPKLSDAELDALHQRRLRRPRRPRRRAPRRVHRLGQLRALGRPRRRRRRVHGRRRPAGQGHRHAAARAPRGDRPLQRHRPLHRRGARRQPADARRVQPRRLAGRAPLRERRRRPRLPARRHRGVPRLGRAARAARRLPGRWPACSCPARSPSSAPATQPGSVGDALWHNVTASGHRRGVPREPGATTPSADAGRGRACRTSPPTSRSPSSPCPAAALAGGDRRLHRRARAAAP